jgi:hypothetical protein|tara:strand:- start:959 stop:1372 length:414 start_codon:yes stop_codon:yes gene_type:complete
MSFSGNAFGKRPSVFVCHLEPLGVPDVRFQATPVFLGFVFRFRKGAAHVADGLATRLLVTRVVPGFALPLRIRVFIPKFPIVTSQNKLFPIRNARAFRSARGGSAPVHGDVFYGERKFVSRNGFVFVFLALPKPGIR